ncbi:GCN5-like N-acetyltransferase [Plautia stali symbiont]|nr:GCN5-like N-acetyltransferase [Plautia stali symbiont]
MNIREAQAKDSFALSALLTELGYRGTEKFISDRLGQLCAHPDETLLVAEHGNQLLGFLSLHFIPQLALAGDFARISYFCIAEGERSKGSGQQLLNHAEQLARARGCDRMEVHCHAPRD